IIFSTNHFPRVLDPDPDRGLTGAFCPWPPLYDLALAGQARLLGAHAVRDVLRTAIWVPPLFTALFAALLTAFLAFRSGFAAGLALLAILLFGRGREPLLAAGLGFALAAAGVLAYRAARPAGYPESAWYLGTSHAAALVAGAVACAVAARGRSEGERAAGW